MSFIDRLLRRRPVPPEIEVYIASLPGAAEVGVLFDVEQLDDSSYGRRAWSLVFNSLSPENLTGATLFCGDVEIRVGARPYGFCIGIAVDRAFSSDRTPLLHFARCLWLAEGKGLAPRETRLVYGALQRTHGLLSCLTVTPAGVRTTDDSAFGWLLRLAADQGWGELRASSLAASTFVEGERFFALEQFDAAARAYERASKAGDAQATHKLAVMYRNGLGVGQELDRAIELLQKAVSLGCGDAAQDLGGLYWVGDAVAQNSAAAVFWFTKGAEFGNVDSQANLGAIFLNGLRGVEKDFANALRWNRLAGNAGDAQALNNLGVIYHNGLGVQQDYAEARRWYEAAMAAGDAEACANLGKLALCGLGVDRNVAEAVMWFKRGADAGHVGAQAALADAYLRGEGVERDVQKAAHWLQKAAEQGHGGARQVLGQLKAGESGIIARPLTDV